MKDLIGTLLFITAIIICWALMIRGIANTKLLKQINEKGEITIYDQVYSCKLKGVWKDEHRFIPVEIR